MKREEKAARRSSHRNKIEERTKKKINYEEEEIAQWPQREERSK